MVAYVTEGIRKVLEREEPLLLKLTQEAVSVPRNNQGRSARQILGHLIDSASNNHQRMVRLQYNGVLNFPDYTQDNDRWIAVQDYGHEDWQVLVQLWKYYNLHMIHLMISADATQFDNYWVDFEGNKVTLGEMIVGYLRHLEMHLSEIHELTD